MDRRIVVTFVAALLIEVESDVSLMELILTPPNNRTNSSTTATPCICSSSTANQRFPSASPPPALPTLAVLVVNLDKKCSGEVHLSLHPSVSAPVCHDSRSYIHRRWPKVCSMWSRCGGRPVWNQKSGNLQVGYKITLDGQLDNTTCSPLLVQCQVKPDHSRELVGYKVATGLLCVTVLTVLLIRFGRPSIKAFTKKMSDRRQSRWIGPTQSQSVSYHRGKAAVHTDCDTEKRLSYPALERLTVNNSREP